MIIRSKAPLRLGLAGGGSDISPYSDMYGGQVLNATINLYCFCSIEETDDCKITIESFDADTHESHVVSSHLEIANGAPLIKGVYNRVVKDLNLEPSSFKITTYNDAPAGSLVWAHRLVWLFAYSRHSSSGKTCFWEIMS